MLVCATAHFLVHSVGVAASRITILTPYKGQLHVLRNMMRSVGLADRNSGQAVDVQTVDSFQGEACQTLTLPFQGEA